MDTHPTLDRKDLKKLPTPHEKVGRRVTLDPSERPAAHNILRGMQFVYTVPDGTLAITLRRWTIRAENSSTGRTRRCAIASVYRRYGPEHNGQVLTQTINLGCRVFRAMVVNHVLGRMQFQPENESPNSKLVFNWPSSVDHGKAVQAMLPDGHPKKKQVRTLTEAEQHAEFERMYAEDVKEADLIST